MLHLASRNAHAVQDAVQFASRADRLESCVVCVVCRSRRARAAARARTTELRDPRWPLRKRVTALVIMIDGLVQINYTD